MNSIESRKDWMLNFFKEKGHANTQNENFQFWQHGNHPIEMDNAEILEQKLDYIHCNPVEAGYVTEPYYWKYSSAVDYEGIKGDVEIEMIR